MWKLATVCLFCIGVVGCGTVVKNETSTNCVEFSAGASNLKPCWLFNKIDVGVVVSSQKHIKGWGKTKEHLFAIALKQLSLTENGAEINTVTKVVTNTQVVAVDGIETVSSQNSVVENVSINNKEKITITAVIEDYYFDNSIQVGYLWATKK